jgi:hypothetical protein
MESEQGGLKLKAGQERKAAMDRVANGFEQAIGKIVEMVRRPPRRSRLRPATMR